MVYFDPTLHSVCAMFLWKHSFDTSGTTTAVKQQRCLDVAGKVTAAEEYRTHSERVEIDSFLKGPLINADWRRPGLLETAALPARRVVSCTPQAGRA